MIKKKIFLMIEKTQTITKMLEDKSYDSTLLIETDKSVIDCLTDSYYKKFYLSFIE